MYHISVMKNEVIELLRIKPGGFYIDATFGQGGHTAEIMQKGGFVMCIDKDYTAFQYYEKLTKKFPNNGIFVHNTFANIKSVWKENAFPLKADGIVFDLGFSTNQIKNNEGFSYLNNTFLDMRYNKNIGITAHEWLMETQLDKMINVFFEYGEEAKSVMIANAICEIRKNYNIQNTRELVDIIKKTVGNDVNAIKSVARIFQAIRIEINNELEEARIGVHNAKSLLKQYGVLIVITFHSVEDRLIKGLFKNESINELVLPTPEEIKKNPKARSAKLRYMVKC